ncbi:MAG: cell division protein ZapA [Anaerobutyricum sp.]
MMNMEGKRELSVVIDGKVYRLSGGSDSYLQKLASYVDGKISELKTQAGYNKLSTEYRDILLALTIARRSVQAARRRLKYLIRMAETGLRSFMN